MSRTSKILKFASSALLIGGTVLFLFAGYEMYHKSKKDGGKGSSGEGGNIAELKIAPQEPVDQEFVEALSKAIAVHAVELKGAAAKRRKISRGAAARKKRTEKKKADLRVAPKPKADAQVEQQIEESDEGEFFSAEEGEEPDEDQTDGNENYEETALPPPSIQPGYEESDNYNETTASSDSGFQEPRHVVYADPDPRSYERVAENEKGYRHGWSHWDKNLSDGAAKQVRAPRDKNGEILLGFEGIPNEKIETPSSGWLQWITAFFKKDQKQRSGQKKDKDGKIPLGFEELETSTDPEYPLPTPPRHTPSAPPYPEPRHHPYY